MVTSIHKLRSLHNIQVHDMYKYMNTAIVPTTYLLHTHKLSRPHLWMYMYSIQVHIQGHVPTCTCGLTHLMNVNHTTKLGKLLDVGHGHPSNQLYTA